MDNPTNTFQDGFPGGHSIEVEPPLCAYIVRYTFASEIREQFRIRRWHPIWAIQPS